MKIEAYIVSSQYSSVKSFLWHHPKATIHKVNGREVNGTCENCKKLIFGRTYITSDEVVLCGRCWRDLFGKAKGGRG